MTKARFNLVMPLMLVMLPGAAAAQTHAPHTSGESVFVEGASDCADGVVKDDGTLETGYGWVPTAIDGRYVQEFRISEFRSRKMEEICICWTRTRPDDTIDFTIELYRAVGGHPAWLPEASFQATATGVKTFPDGTFFSIDVSDIEMLAPTETFYLGVRWDPSADQYFFVCADHTPTTEIVDGWFIDDRADEWASVLDANDPIFDDHRAMMIRARAAEGVYPRIPTQGPVGLAVLAAVLALLGAALLRRQG